MNWGYFVVDKKVLNDKEQYFFQLKAPNNEVIATSEFYTTKAACLKGIDAVKRYAGAAEIRYEI